MENTWHKVVLDKYCCYYFKNGYFCYSFCHLFAVVRTLKDEDRSIKIVNNLNINIIKKYSLMKN